MSSYIANIIDFFIKKTNQLKTEELNQKRILVQILLTILFMNVVFFIFTILGHFDDEFTLGLFIFAAIGLSLIKFSSSNLLISTFLNGALTLTASLNVCNTGYIYSYNNKWFIVLLLFVNMSAKKQTFYYLLFYLSLQFAFYFYTTEDLSLISNKEEYLVDNFFALVLGYSFIQFFNRLEKLQRTRINNQNVLLREQKEALIENNNLLKKQSKQLLDSNQELERFAHIASHDLKSPLRNIINFSNLLSNELKGMKNDNANQYLNFINKGSIKMNILIEDILEYSNLSRNSMDKEAVDLNKVIQSITDSISTYIERKNVQIKVQEGLPFIKDHRTKIYLLFKNLIENGIKYNQSTTPTLEIGFKEHPTYYLFSVKDNGIGIASKYQHKIFDIFARLHGDDKYEGTGLGLALCKKIVLSMDGEISVISEENQGATFLIKIDKKLIVTPNHYTLVTTEK